MDGASFKLSSVAVFQGEHFARQHLGREYYAAVRFQQIVDDDVGRLHTRIFSGDLFDVFKNQEVETSERLLEFLAKSAYNGVHKAGNKIASVDPHHFLGGEVVAVQMLKFKHGFMEAFLFITQIDGIEGLGARKIMVDLHESLQEFIACLCLHYAASVKKIDLFYFKRYSITPWCPIEGPSKQVE